MLLKTREKKVQNTAVALAAVGGIVRNPKKTERLSTRG